MALAQDTARWLVEQGHEAVLLPELDGSGKEQALEDRSCELDLLVSLGGDGTMLRSAGLVLGYGVPVLGVNFGRFGFLTAVEPENIRQAIGRFLTGDYLPERRMTLELELLSTAEGQVVQKACALNDVVLARPSGTHTISTWVSLSGQRFLSYAADAMILATPTGSTGYNLSARGPILSPSLRSIVLTPVAAHMLFDRSLVLGPDVEVALDLQGRCDADLIVDGVHTGQLGLGQRLVCRVGRQDAVLVSFGDRKFESVLKAKFHLADR